MGAFAEEVTVEHQSPGRYTCELSQDWNVVAFPQGGIVTSLALRAAGAEVGSPDHQLRSCTTVFAGQVTAGPLEVEARVLRRGRSATQVLATISNQGAESGASVIAVFGGQRRGPTFVDVEAPPFPPPGECPSYRDPPPPGVEPLFPTPFWSRVEGRAAFGHAPWEDYEPVSSDVGTWLRFDDPPRLADGALDPLGLLTLADRMPGCVGERMGPGERNWFAPSADLTFHLFEPLRTEWVLAHDRARWAGDGWASAECRLWDEHGALVAYATQMMLFTYLA